MGIWLAVLFLCFFMLLGGVGTIIISNRRKRFEPIVYNKRQSVGFTTSINDHLVRNKNQQRRQSTNGGSSSTSNDMLLTTAIVSSASSCGPTSHSSYSGGQALARVHVQVVIQAHTVRVIDD